MQFGTKNSISEGLKSQMKSKLTRVVGKIKKNEDGKVLVKNFAYLSLLQVAGYVFPLITMPYLARVIGIEGFGKIAFASAVMVWVQTIADWGFNFTATRDVAKNRDNSQMVSEIFSNVLWARCVLMILSFVFLLLLIALFPKFRVNSNILLVSFLMVPGHILFPDWFFQAMERMKYITILNVISKLLFTIAVFVFIKDKEDYIIQPLLTSLGFVVSGIIAFYYILVKWKIKLLKPSISKIKETIRKSTDVFLNALMPNLYNSFSTVLLGVFWGEVANGKLDVGAKFVNIAQQFMLVLSRTFFPFLSRKLDKHNVYAQLNIALSLGMSVILFFSAPLIIDWLFTEEFAESVLVLRIMSISIFFLALNNIYGTNYMIIAGYESQLRNITAIVSVVGFAMSFPLIYFWGFIGAAITVTLTRGLLGTSVMLRAKMLKQKDVRQD